MITVSKTPASTAATATASLGKRNQLKNGDYEILMVPIDLHKKIYEDSLFHSLSFSLEILSFSTFQAFWESVERKIQIK